MATRCSSFELQATVGQARAGLLSLPHGQIPTPAFMAVGTRGSVRGLMPTELRRSGSHIVLANTYHLWVRPGHETVAALGGLHRFMAWDGPILTDSGGYQIFSMRDRLKLTEQGVTIRSPEDGEYRTLTPELAVEIQETMGVDVAMAFDECLAPTGDRDRVARSTERTTRWLHRCLAARKRPEQTALFGIVQGGTQEDLRRAHAEELTALDLDGYAVGGLSVGEPREVMLAMTEVSTQVLPTDRIRYLMGVGHPHDIVDAVLRGIDLFDCVMPTRAGRHGHAYTSVGRCNLKNSRYRADVQPLDPDCDCEACVHFSRGTLRHLVKCGEMLGMRMVALHNLTFYHRILRDLRAAILAGDEPGIAEVRARAVRSTQPLAAP